MSLDPYSKSDNSVIIIMNPQETANELQFGHPKTICTKLSFFTRFLKTIFLLPWQSEFYMEGKSLNNFERGSPKKHSSAVW